jgi:hypothetical protein
MWSIDDGDTSTDQSQRDNSGLVFAEKLAERGAVVLLQAPPVDGGVSSLGNHRITVLECARTIVAAGANAVFILPPMPDRLAQETSVRIASAVTSGGKAPTLRDLLAALADVKKIVADGQQAARSWSEWPVLDVLLIARR